MRWLMVILGVLAAAALPSAARAEHRTSQTMFASAPVNGETLFAVAPVSDETLSEMRGGQGLFSRLTVGGTARLLDDHARADLRLTGGVSRVEMDVWWGTTGSELIAQSVRAAGGP